MILALRVVARMLTLVLLLALALAGLAVAVFSIGANDDPLSLAALAQHIQLPELEDDVGGWLGQLETDGPLARWSALGGFCALVAALLFAATLLPRRERLVLLDETETGELRARRRTLGQIAEALAEQQSGVTGAKARVRPRRVGQGGSLKVRASRPRRLAPELVKERATRALTPLASDFHLRPRVRSRLGKGKERVQ